VRFGTQGRKSLEIGVSAHASQDETVESKVKQIKEKAWRGYQNTIFKNLSEEGVIYEFLPNYYLEKGVLAEALEFCYTELADMKRIYGELHNLTTLAKNNIAGILTIQGKWKDAEVLEVEVMETRKTKLGADHPSALTSMANLASTYGNQGR
jgi:hypothetical protein